MHLDKLTKFGLGAKIESLFIETLQHIFIASHKAQGDKILSLNKASDAFDILKFMLQVMWDMNMLDAKKYIALSHELEGIGQQLGGWQRKTKTSLRGF